MTLHNSFILTEGCLRLQQATDLPPVLIVQYRTWKDLRDVEYVAPRVGDKVIFALIVMTL